MNVRKCLPLDHLDRMTDSTGLIQHAIYSVPRRESGYTIDDNARALMVSTYMAELELGNGEALTLASRYLAFIGYAFNRETGRFRNFMDYQKMLVFRVFLETNLRTVVI